MIQKNPFIGNTVKLSGSADVSALKEDGTGIVLDIISPEQAEVGHLVLRPRNYKDGEEYLALEAYSGDWNERAWKIDRDPIVRTKDFSVTFSNNGDAGFTLPSDCTTPISCHIVGAWGTVSLYAYSGSWGFHSVELANTTQTVRLVYV